jgi:exodeoxyribonuclease VII small subunit
MKATKKNALPTGDAAAAMSFEQALQRLEKIVGDMESAELPLEDVLKKYEEGTRLVRFCSQKLDEAEKKIELLTKRADGKVALKPFDAPAAKAEDDSAEENEAKLF